MVVFMQIKGSLLRCVSAHGIVHFPIQRLQHVFGNQKLDVSYAVKIITIIELLVKGLKSKKNNNCLIILCLIQLVDYHNAIK